MQLSQILLVGLATIVHTALAAHVRNTFLYLRYLLTIHSVKLAVRTGPTAVGEAMTVINLASDKITTVGFVGVTRQTTAPISYGTASQCQRLAMLIAATPLTAGELGALSNLVGSKQVGNILLLVDSGRRGQWQLSTGSSNVSIFLELKSE
ncbi:hypothetical protein EDB80DRAFT_682559 [Ilyonectria destructans]|nr:hypothetical protein EDB80DRAFT_682559 [Ilyonectria destructans]